VILNRLNPKACNLSGRLFGDHNIRAAILKIVTGHFKNPDGVFHGMVFIEFDVDHVVLFNLGNRMGGDQLGVKTLGHIGQVLHHTLDIHYHGITGAGDNHKFLL